MTNFRCPNCGSQHLVDNMDEIQCIDCGNREYLFDYPNAFDIRGGPEYKPLNAFLEGKIKELDSLIAEMKKFTPTGISEEVNQLKAEVIDWRKKHAEALAAIDQVKSISIRKKNKYIDYTA